MQQNATADTAPRDLVPTARDLATILELADDALFTAPALKQALALLNEKAGGLTADVSTEDGRREINVLSRGVGGAITRLDDRRKAYVAALKARPAAIDKLFREQFREPAEKIKDQIRAPLDRWTEDQRAADEETGRLLAELNAPIEVGTSVADLAKRLDAAMNLDLPDWLRQDQREAIAAAMGAAITRLEAAHAAAAQAAAQAAELETLRAQAAERERADRDARIAKEAAERATQEAERRTNSQAQAAEQARQDAERRALEAEQRQAQAEAAAARQAAEAEQRRRQAEAESERRAVAAGLEERERAKVAAMEEEAAARRRAADRDHAAGINREVLADLCGLGLSEVQGKLLIAAIARRQIPHLSIAY